MMYVFHLVRCEVVLGAGRAGQLHGAGPARHQLRVERGLGNHELPG